MILPPVLFVAGDGGVYIPIACISISVPFLWCLDYCWWVGPSLWKKSEGYRNEPLLPLLLSFSLRLPVAWPNPPVHKLYVDQEENDSQISLKEKPDILHSVPTRRLEGSSCRTPLESQIPVSYLVP